MRTSPALQPDGSPFPDSGCSSAGRELLGLLQGHISHLKPQLAVAVAMNLLEHAEDLITAPSMLPQRVSAAIQELAALHRNTVPCLELPESSSAAGGPFETTPDASPEQVENAGEDRAKVAHGSCWKVNDNAHAQERAAAEMLVSRKSAPTPVDEQGDENLCCGTRGMLGTTVPSFKQGRQLRMRKRNSEPLPNLLESPCDSTLVRLGSKRKMQHEASVQFDPSPIHQRDMDIPEQIALNGNLHTASPPLDLEEGQTGHQAIMQPFIVCQPSSHVDLPPAKVHDYPSDTLISEGGSGTPTASDDDEDVGKAVARAVKQQLSGMPILAQALTSLMLHDGLCTHEELLRVAAGGRPSVVEMTAAAAITRAMDHFIWLDQLPSESSPQSRSQEQVNSPCDVELPPELVAPQLHLSKAMNFARSRSVNSACNDTRVSRCASPPLLCRSHTGISSPDEAGPSVCSRDFSFVSARQPNILEQSGVKWSAQEKVVGKELRAHLVAFADDVCTSADLATAGDVREFTAGLHPPGH